MSTGPARWLTSASIVIATLVTASGAHADAQSVTSTTSTQPAHYCRRSDVRTFGALQRETQRLEGMPRPSGPERCELAELYFRAGQVDRAERALQALVRSEPSNVNVLLALSALYQHTYRFDDADRLLARAASLRPRSIDVRLQQADVASARSDVARAESLYREVLRDDPMSLRAALGLARVSYTHSQFDSAQVQLEHILRQDSLNAPALLLRATIYRELQQTQPWKAATRRALAVDSLSAEAHSAQAPVLRDEGRIDLAYGEALTALSLDPYNGGAHGYIGNGGSVTSYGKYPPLADDSVSKSLAAQLDSGDHALRQRQFVRAGQIYRAALAQHPTLAAAMLGLGDVDYRSGDYHAALDWFQRAARAYPDLGIAHYGAATSMQALRDARNVQVRAAVARFHRLPRPAEPSRLREVFPDFNHLDADLQKVILLSASPVSHYIPLLATAGATFRLIPFEERMWEMSGEARSRGTRTFDLRLWDDVKGHGGFHALSGEEWVRDAMNGRYNVLSHEFMHQVHGTAFTDAQRDSVKRLFEAAKRERRTLDYYADFNEMEYFAQAYEASISDEKLPDQKGTSGHTRAEVEGRDPAVYAFIRGLNERPSYHENEIVAYRQKIQALLGEGKIADANDAALLALRTYGDQPDLLVQLGVARRLAGTYAAAVDAHQKAVTLFPNEVGGYVGLADDYVFGWRDYNRAVGVLTRFVQRQPGSAEGWMRLAGIALAAGRLDKARQAVAHADTLIQAPNPYAAYSTPAAVGARVAFLAGDDTAAVRLYRYNIERINRNDIGAWTDLATIALNRRDTSAARVALVSALTINRKDPRVREVEAKLLTFGGERAAARDTLVRLLAEDTTRLETITALVAQLRTEAPEQAAAYVEQGFRLVDDTTPVRFVFKDDRFQARRSLTMPVIAQFETEAGLLAEGQHDLARAVERHQAAVRAFAYDFPSIVALVRLYTQMGERVQAESWSHRLAQMKAPQQYLDEVQGLSRSN